LVVSAARTKEEDRGQETEDSGQRTEHRREETESGHVAWFFAVLGRRD
jgi:hypothetical protein